MLRFQCHVGNVREAGSMTTSRARDAFRQVRKEEILDAAMAVFVREGSDVSLEEIAKAVGLTRGALYRYFPSREVLVREVFARCFDSSKRMLEEVLDQSGSPLQALQSLVEMSAQGYRQDGAREGMVLNLQAVLATAQGDTSTASPVIDGSVVESAIALAHQASASGEIRDDVDPVGLALLVLSALQGLQLMIAMFGDEIDGNAATRSLLDAIEGARRGPE
jgi:AcrR family transcriptional regulator